MQDCEFYHSFWTFGLSNRQKSGVYPVNQRCKEQYVLGYLLVALARARGRTVNYQPSVLELFCADAYYGFFAKRFGAGRVVAVDNDPDSLQEASIMRDVLGLEIDLRLQDVCDLEPTENYDVVICTGGLYHLKDPAAFLRKIRKNVKRYLVVQSVVTLESEDPNYFVAPAPGWKHGCRFSAGYFVGLLRDAGFYILGYGFNHLEGNDQVYDRGSCYALCSVEPEPPPDSVVEKS